ncbi:fibronectin type III domain-containing protein [Flavicella sp.]|nr:fibronectin type III domain-containing protein [Flavicella sp.]MDA9111424.1 fibronectin type III domain-containing protein [Flavicella sp.]
MKSLQFLTTILLFLIITNITAQVGINNSNPHESAALDITSTTGGLLMPRMTNAERQAITNPAEGLMVYVTDFDGGALMIFDGIGWTALFLTTLIKRPDAPTIGAANAENGQATVSFTAPSNDGGSTITSYTATSNPGGITGTVTQSGSGSIPLTGLTNDTAYTFTVTATNAIGTSAASAASNIVTPIANTVPDPPTIGTANAGNAQATISFTAPSNDGGSTITSYTATSNPGGITGTVNQSGSGSITVTRLTNDTAYTFSVTATNAIGTSAASAASNSATPVYVEPEVGDFYQGGVVFYLFEPGDEGYVAGEIHGLTAAIVDQSSAIQWSNSYGYITPNGQAIGSGSSNTDAIISNQGAPEISYAAGLARAYNGGGYTDWFLPSKDELFKMCLNKAAIDTTAVANGGSNFSVSWYWSSSQADYNKAVQYFFDNTCYLDAYFTPNEYAVRAVRAF